MLNLNCKHFLIFAGTDLIEYFKSFTGRKRFYRQTHKQRSSRQTEVVWDCLESGISDKERSPTGGWAGERGDTVTVSDQLRSWGSVHLCVQTHDLTCHYLSLHLFVCTSVQVSPSESVGTHLCVFMCTSMCVFIWVRVCVYYSVCSLQNASDVNHRPHFLKGLHSTHFSAISVTEGAPLHRDLGT